MAYGLIFANDIVNPEEALRVSNLVGPYVDAIKIGITTVLDRGVSMIEETKKRTGKPVVADFKIADIGFYNADKGKWEGTNAKIVEKLAEAGADYIICHSIVGTSSIQECVEVAHSKGSKVLTLPYMTHKGANLFFAHPLNIKHVSDVLNKAGLKVDQNRLEACNTISDAILVLGDILNVDGYIGPANNQLIIKRYRELTLKDIFGPGIGRQSIENLSPKDQLASFYRTCGSRSAAIIGSAIYGVPDPAKSAKEFKEWRDEIVTQI
jgi:orotidine 5'-phosphate decarboxylase subfamily 1